VTRATVPQAFELALQHHRAGRLSEAEGLYRQILAVQPNCFEALNALGAVTCQLGRHGLAVEWIRQAITLQPNSAGAHSNLGAALAGQGRFDEAISAYRRALELKPDHVDAAYNLGNALRDCGRLDEAVATYLRALEIKPDAAEVCNNLGIALGLKGRLDDAVSAYRRALEIKPEYAEARTNLGEALAETGRGDEAIAVLRRALELRPDSAEAYYNLGIALRECGRLDEAVAVYRRALEIKPGYSEAQNNLGNALKEQGRLDEAIAAYRQAMLLRPDVSEIRSNIILALHFHPGPESGVLAREQQLWNERFSEPLARFIEPHANERDPERRLRVGYVSHDFRDHVVGWNILPLFRGHDHESFEILGYSGVEKPDELTEAFRQGADGWRRTVGVGDKALAEIVRQDRVDILVDLSQHTAGNRLPVFAHKPAPVQVSFAGYPESTGVESIGYRISDRYLEAGASEMGDRSSEVGSALPSDLPSSISHSEPALSLSKGPAERVFLLDSFWCYDPRGIDVAINGLPAKENRWVTFGSLANFAKVNDAVLRLWARVLAEVKDSRLLVRSVAGSHCQQTLEVLAREGIEGDRVEFVTPRPRKDYLELYHGVDIVLDPFPYGGHTTSLEALWMGVPVVSLAGERAVSRAGLSILNNLGLPELVAFSEENYVKIAADLAGNLPRLGELRRRLRPRMEASVLMDGPRFARNIEAAYRAMWRQWCAQQAS